MTHEQHGGSIGGELECVCRTDELGSNEMRRHVTVDGRAVAVCRVGDDFFGVDDGCTHEKASLSEGYLDEEYVIECPLHGGSFDVRTGRPKTFPCTVGINTHQVVVDGDRVFLGSEGQA